MRSTASTSIREAAESDVPGLTELGWRFIKFTPYGGMLGADKEGLQAALMALLSSATAACWVVEQDEQIVGCMLAQITAPWCAPKVRIAVELAWWVDPELQNSGVGIRLLKVFEAWSLERSASPVISDLVYTNGPNLGDLCERLGYRLVERAHMKEII